VPLLRQYVADPELLRSLVAKVIVHPTMLQIALVTAATAKHLSVATSAEAEATLLLTCPTRLTRTGHRPRILHNDGRVIAAAPPDASMVKLLVKAQLVRAASARRDHHSGTGTSRGGREILRHPRRSAGVSRTLDHRRCVSCSPIGHADAKRLAFTADLPISWTEQLRHFEVGR
jgi:site-specific DNA recombinase